MRDSWLDLIVARVLRPARPRLEQCLRGRELDLAARRPIVERRARAIARCEAQIERERAAVLAANDGVISWRMRELEREWCAVSRPDPDGEVMDLWARIAPGAWIDCKRWRDSAPAARVDVAIALAADAEGVEAAEVAIGSLRAVLAGGELSIGSRIRWRWFEGDRACVTALLAEPVRAARAALSVHEAELVILERARQFERAIHDAAQTRFPSRPHLARDLAHAAFVDFLFRAAKVADRPNPVAPLRDLWETGYVLAAIDASGVTLEIPPLS